MVNLESVHLPTRPGGPVQEDRVSVSGTGQAAMASVPGTKAVKRDVSDMSSSEDEEEEDATGVSQVKSTGKWYGHVRDCLQGRKRKTLYTPCVATKAEAIRDRAKLKAEVEARYWAHVQKLVDADPGRFAGVPRGSYSAADAEERTVYWRPNYKDKHAPYLVVSIKHGKKGFKWLPACGERGCPNTAANAGCKKEFCLSHGGKCVHGRQWSRCIECNPNAKNQMALCSNCVDKQLNRKRQRSAGGNGLCPGCEEMLKQQAAEAGAEPPPTGKKWEDVFLDALVPLIVDEQGRVISHESRDDFRHMLGSNKRTRRGECSTEHQRRPDILYLVRNTESRLIAAVMVEVDEDSHSDRQDDKLLCETAKVDETFTALWTLAQNEGRGRLAVVRSGDVQTPYVLTLRVNPNACNAPGGPISLATRVAKTAEFVNEVLRTPHAEFRRRYEAGECMLPYVKCLYYHTVKASANLAHFEKSAPCAFHWMGNHCPR